MYVAHISREKAVRFLQETAAVRLPAGRAACNRTPTWRRT